MSKKVLVYGWYHQGVGNLGDNLFVDAFQHLFPQVDFLFTDTITDHLLQDIDAVFFGGGSFLLGAPQIENPASLKGKPIFYLGVGVEEHIHPLHLQWMEQARLIAIRTPDKLSWIQSINHNTMVIPDLVYSLQSQVLEGTRDHNSVLILPNIVVVPSRNDPYWKHAAWNFFKSEFSQFVDWLVDQDYHPHLWGLCHTHELDDDWVSAELLSHMENRHSHMLLSDRPSSISDITKLVSNHQIVITQRFHGIILSEMTRTPYIAIHHHDKLKPSKTNYGKFLSYYGMSKDQLIHNFYQARQSNYPPALSIESDIFVSLVERVNGLL